MSKGVGNVGALKLLEYVSGEPGLRAQATSPWQGGLGKPHLATCTCAPIQACLCPGPEANLPCHMHTVAHSLTLIQALECACWNPCTYTRPQARPHLCANVRRNTLTRTRTHAHSRTSAHGCPCLLRRPQAHARPIKTPHQEACIPTNTTPNLRTLRHPCSPVPTHTAHASARVQARLQTSVRNMHKKEPKCHVQSRTRARACPLNTQYSFRGTVATSHGYSLPWTRYRLRSWRSMNRKEWFTASSDACMVMPWTMMLIGAKYGCQLHVQCTISTPLGNGSFFMESCTHLTMSCTVGATASQGFRGTCV